jgi:hypothetical protein
MPAKGIPGAPLDSGPGPAFWEARRSPSQARVPSVQTGRYRLSQTRFVLRHALPPHHGLVVGAITIPTSSKHDNGQPCSIFSTLWDF